MGCAHKLNLLLRVHAAAVADGLRAGNPAVSSRAACDRRAPEDFGYLSEVELALLFRAVPRDDELKHVRDRALLGSLGPQALRTVEIARANVTDLQPYGDNGPCWSTVTITSALCSGSRHHFGNSVR